MCVAGSVKITLVTVLRLGEGLRTLIRESIRQTSAGAYSALADKHSRLIPRQDKTAVAQNSDVVPLTAIDVRRFLRKIVERDIFTLTGTFPAGIG